MPGASIIRAGTLDDTSWLQPGMEIYCASAHGYFIESILRHGATDPNVTETKCQTLGDSSCTYEMTWR